MTKLAKLAIATCLVLAACGRAHQVKTERSTDGFWRSDGYGYVMQVEHNQVRFFHATSDVCIETDNQELKLEDIFDVQRWGPKGALLLSTTTEPYEFKFHRIQDLPTPCTHAKQNDRPSTVDAVISFFSEHYVFFEERGLNWVSMAKGFRDQATQLTDDTKLYEATVSLLVQTQDAHVELSARVNGEVIKFDADPGLIRRLCSLRASENNSTDREERHLFHREFWVEGIGQQILNGNSFTAANDRIRYGIIDNDIGYIAVRSMGGFVSEDLTDGDNEQAVLDNVMDRAIAHFNHTKVRAVILDVSINSGGYDYIARRLAGRFFETPIEAYDKFAGEAHDKKPQPQIIGPAGQSQFIGPVYLLTSSETVSAGELLTIAMRARPGVTHVGGRTRGALSTKLAKLLPNGWELTLSNEVYRDHLGKRWEAKGIPPQIPLKIFPDRQIDDLNLLEINLPATHQAAVGQVIQLVQNDNALRPN